MTTQQVLTAVAWADVTICAARASPWPLTMFCATIIGINLAVIRRCLK